MSLRTLLTTCVNPREPYLLSGSFYLENLVYLNTNLHIIMTVLFILIAVLKKILPRIILRFLRWWRNRLSPCMNLVILLAVSKIQYKKIAGIDITTNI